MPREEVNAWASYEQTARTPRRLSVVEDIGNLRHRRAAVSHHGNDTGNFTRHSHRLAQSLSLSRHTVDLAALGLSLPPPRQFFQDALLAEQGQSTACPPLAEGGVKAADFDTSVLEKIRTTFDVFFDDNMAARNTEKNSRPQGIKKLFQSLNATMPWTRSNMNSSILLFVDLCLRGIGQVVFQNSPLAGVFILIGLLIQSPRVALHGVLGLVATNAVALLLGFDQGLAGSGLFGYNALLVGLALATFDANQSFNAATLIASVVIATFTSILFVMMGKLLVPYKSPPLTLPFNVATLLYLLSTAQMGRVDYGSVRNPAIPDYEGENDGDFSITAAQFFAGTIRGLGQVYLADHLAAGVFVLAGMAACSRISAAAALAGSAIGSLVAVATGVPVRAVEIGLYGFNPCLTVTAMFMFYSPSWGAGILAVMAGAMTVIAQQALATLLEPWGLPFMTLPFCVACLPFIVIQGTSSIVIAVPLASMTVPEDHLRVVKMLTDGFALLKEALMVPEPNESSERSTLTKMNSRKLSKSLSLLGEAVDQADKAHRGDAAVKGKHKRQGWERSFEDPKEMETTKAAIEIFQALQRGDGEETVEEVPFYRITDAFRAAGLNDTEALNFASLILTLIDLDESASIDQAEFVCFALVARAMCIMRSKIVQFFDFVDEDGNGSVSFDEIDAALAYLGQPVLDESSKELLLQLTLDHGCKVEAVDHGDVDEMDIMELVNVVTVAKVKAYTSAFHGADYSNTSRTVASRIGAKGKGSSAGGCGKDLDC